MNRLEELKRTIFIVRIMYREEIRKKLLKILILLNFVLAFISWGTNAISLGIYALNMFYLYNYLKKLYPEEDIKIKDRYESLKK